MALVRVYIERPSARSRYAISQVVERMLGWRVEFVDTIVEITNSEVPLLVYGRIPVNGAFHVYPQGSLDVDEIEELDPPVGSVNGVPVLFPAQKGDLKYDLFAGAFYLLTCYQEFSGVRLDEHQRPISKDLHCVRHGYVHRPVIDEWSLQLAAQWKAMDPRVPDPIRKYKQVVTMDLDNGFKYRGREWWRTAGSLVRDMLNGSYSNVSERFRVLKGDQQDPYDIYGTLKDELSEVSDRTIFFVLTAPRSKWDHAVPVTYVPYAERLKGLSHWAEVGLHPSYKEKFDEQLLRREKIDLQLAVGQTVKLSRHHFLRITVPDSFPRLVNEGFTEDHTMGLHDTPGFRVGTCTPFKWYDLSTEKELPIMVHPFCVMDNTLRNKMKLNPDEAVEHVTELIQHVRDVDGTFSGLWHESFLSDHGEYEGWGKAIRRIMTNAKA